jgi:hypothetical protein
MKWAKRHGMNMVSLHRGFALDELCAGYLRYHFQG